MQWGIKFKKNLTRKHVSDFSTLHWLRYGLHDRPIASQFRAGTRDVSFVPDTWNRSAVHPDTIHNAIEGGEGVRLPNYLHSSGQFQNEWSSTSTSLMTLWRIHEQFNYSHIINYEKKVSGRETSEFSWQPTTMEYLVCYMRSGTKNND